jgi:hypothetical protein
LSVKGAEMLSNLYESNESFAASVFSSVDDKEAKGLHKVLTALLARLSALEDRLAA